jgi:hemolysin activation/secretion protein
VCRTQSCHLGDAVLPLIVATLHTLGTVLGFIVRTSSNIGIRGQRQVRGRHWGCVVWVISLMLVEIGTCEEKQSEESAPPMRFNIREFRVLGAKSMKRLPVEEVVYPYLGPRRTEEDVEAARLALEKLYQSNGYQAVSVEIPPQNALSGVVVFQVREGTVGQVRVKGSRYFLPSRIKEMAKSLEEGKVLNFNDVTRDIVALNQWQDRQVTPSLRPGLEPGTVDIDLTVKDKLPLHASAELNNRYSPMTSPLRLNFSASYTNLWQLGHTVALSHQMSPEVPGEVSVWSGSYAFRLNAFEGMSWRIQGVKQNSNVSTLGGLAILGRGEVLGFYATWDLPVAQDFTQSFSLGFDYKDFDQQIETAGGGLITAPIRYIPFTASYLAGWRGDKVSTDLSTNLVWHFRGMGSDGAGFNRSRYKAGGSFIYLRGDLTQTREFSHGGQMMWKAQWQVADQPLVNSEQFTGGGVNSVRGYLEASAVGDRGLMGTLELRSPVILKSAMREGDEVRLHGFVEGGILEVSTPLPEQKSSTRLMSVGMGSRVQVGTHVSGSLDVGFPLIAASQTRRLEPFISFRLWTGF